jgi:hypothetical protein
MYNVLQPGGPDEFVNNRPKCSPAYFLLKYVNQIFTLENSIFITG